MAMNYKKFFRHDKYTIEDLFINCIKLKKSYSNVSYEIRKGEVNVLIELKPTVGSQNYTVKIVSKVNWSHVKVYIVKPRLHKVSKGKKIPHLYTDGSLCLYYPKSKEWNMHDMWAETIVPWTCLWLYYFELWEATGVWYGGGIYPH